MQRLKEFAEIERRLSAHTDASASLRLIVESAVELTGAAGGAFWVGDPSEPDSLAAVVCAVGAATVGRDRTAAAEGAGGREPWTAVERRRRISSVAAVVAGRTAGVLTIFHPDRPPSDDTELILVLLAARAAGVVASSECSERLTARDEFLVRAAHQLRTPMTTLRLELQGLDRGLRQSERQDTHTAQLRQALERAIRQCDRAQSTGEHLLDLLELRTPRICLNRSSTDLAELVEGVASRVAEELTHARCRLVTSLQRGVVGAWDGARLEQVVSALLMNAAKHAPGSRVELSVAATTDGAILSVKDHGGGIRPEHADRIFDRFARVPSIEPVGSWGLGLFFCRRIVEAHGGTIRVISTPGLGSEFMVELPRVAPLDLRTLRARHAPPSQPS